MENPNFDFYAYIQAVMTKMGFRGYTLEEKIHETVQRLFLDVQEAYTKVGEDGAEKIGPGPILRRYDGRIPFDTFFKHSVKNRGQSESRDRSKAKEKFDTVNISKGGAEEGQPGQGISEETLGGGEIDQGDYGQDAESADYLQTTYRSMVRYLSMQRHGDMLTTIFKLITPPPQGEGLSQGEVVDWLNREQVASPTGATTWSTGMVNSYVQKIRAAVQTYIEEENRGEQGEGVLKPLYDRKFRRPAVPEGTPSTQKGPIQAMWFPKGDTTKAQKVTLIRKSLKNSRVQLQDGTAILVPTDELRF